MPLGQSTEGNAWKANSLKKLLTNPRIAGLRARWATSPDRWELVLDADMRPVKAVWEGILTVVEFEALQGILSARKAAFSKGEA